MKNMLRNVWSRDKRGFMTILIMNVAVSLTSGISIVMLIPMLGLLNISEGSTSALHRLIGPMQAIPYSAQVIILVSLYFVLVLFKALIGRILAIRETQFLEDYSFNLRDSLYKAVARADWEKLAASKQADTINLFTSQCSQVSHGVTEIIHLISSMVSSVMQLVIAVWLSLPVTVFVLICGSAFVLMFKRMFRISKQYGEELIRLNRNMYSELFNQLRSIKEVRSYGVQKEHAQLFGDISNSFRTAKMRFVRLRAVPQVIYSCAAAAMIGIIFIVCVLMFDMDTARLMVLVYVFMRLWPVFSSLYGRIQSINTSVPALEKLEEALEMLSRDDDADENAAPMPFEKAIEFKNVSFAYQGSEETVLKNASFTLPKGTITALVGRSGAGKTTIADLLLGFLYPTSGEILIDGAPLTRENLPAWRHALGYIPQEPLIINASVRENLNRFHPSATDDDMIEALESGKVGYFAADTITLEPAPDDYCLFNMSPDAMDRFIVTAHTAGRTEEAMHRMISWSLKACLDVEAGKLPPNIVNGVTSIRKTE